MMKRIKGWLFCLGLRKNSGFLSWKGSSLIAARQKVFSLSTEAAVGAALMATARASPERSPQRGALRKLRAGGVRGACFKRLSAGLGNSVGLECLGFPLWERQRTVFPGCAERCKPRKATAGRPSVVRWCLCTQLLCPCWGGSCVSKYVVLRAVGRACKSTMGQESLPWNKGLGQARNITEPGSSPLISCIIPYTALQGWFLTLDLGEKNGKLLSTSLLPVTHTYFSTQSY